MLQVFKSRISLKNVKSILGFLVSLKPAEGLRLIIANQELGLHVTSGHSNFYLNTWEARFQHPSFLLSAHLKITSERSKILSERHGWRGRGVENVWNVSSGVTQKHCPPVRGPPQRTGSTNHLTDRSTDYPPPSTEPLKTTLEIAKKFEFDLTYQ